MLDSTLGKGSKAKVGDEGTVDDRCTDTNNAGITRSHEKLWQAVEKEDAAVAEKYLDNIAEQGTNIEESDLMDSVGQSMIHKCASLGYADILMLLLERTGAKPDLVNGQLATPLHLACRNDRESIVKFLIGCGVDCNA
jgi:ankyrin repeat protein